MSDRHPYRVTFTLPSNPAMRTLTYTLAESSEDAKRRVAAAYSAQGNGATVLSARKRKLTKCAFYRQFGRAETEKYFNCELPGAPQP